jgi:hypothetical protein
MKKEILNCFTWYANRVAESVQYESWSDEYARKDLKKATEMFLEELKKHIDWEHLTEEECRELRFGIWDTDEGIDEEIDALKFGWEGSAAQKEGKNLDEIIADLERTKGLRLIPLYLLPIVPIGTELVSIGGQIIIYDGCNVDKDMRCGYIAYGIKLN